MAWASTHCLADFLVDHAELLDDILTAGVAHSSPVAA
jgi:hypothetical protein